MYMSTDRPMATWFFADIARVDLLFLNIQLIMNNPIKQLQIFWATITEKKNTWDWKFKSWVPRLKIGQLWEVFSGNLIEHWKALLPAYSRELFQQNKHTFTNLNINTFLCKQYLFQLYDESSCKHFGKMANIRENVYRYYIQSSPQTLCTLVAMFTGNLSEV